MLNRWLVLGIERWVETNVPHSRSLSFLITVSRIRPLEVIEDWLLDVWLLFWLFLFEGRQRELQTYLRFESANLTVPHQSLALVLQEELERHGVIWKTIGDNLVEQVDFSARHLLLLGFKLAELALRNPLITFPNRCVVLDVPRVRPRVSIGNRLIITLRELELKDLPSALRVLRKSLLNANLNWAIVI